MNIATASLSRRGTRASNQDQTGETIGERSACFVVCDGIAGLPGGEVAAELARNSIISRFDGDKHLNAQHIRDYVQTANRTILSEQQAVQDYRRMGTTPGQPVYRPGLPSGLLGTRRGQPSVPVSSRLAVACHHRPQPGSADERCRSPDR